jgi:hypothetical protein
MFIIETAVLKNNKHEYFLIYIWHSFTGSVISNASSSNSLNYVDAQKHPDIYIWSSQWFQNEFTQLTKDFSQTS